MGRTDWLAAMRRWIAPAKPVAPRAHEAEYDEAVAAIRALRSLFEAELTRREAGRNGGKTAGE